MSRLNVVGRGKCLKSVEVLPEQVGGDRVSRRQLQSRYCERDLTNGLTEDTGDGLLTEIRQKAVPSISLRRPNVPHDEARKTELYSRQERECRELSKEFALMKMEEKDKENKFEIEKLKMENRRLRDKIRIDELEAKLSEAKATLTISNRKTQMTILEESEIDLLAEKFKFQKSRVRLRDEGKVASYSKGGGGLTVYLSTGTVATFQETNRGKCEVEHFRRNMTMADIKTIFQEEKIPVSRAFHRMSNEERVERDDDMSYCRYKFRYERMEDTFIEDLDSIYDKMHSVSLGYDGYFILYNDGSYNYHNIPRRLKERLKDRSPQDPIPEVVQLGTYNPDTYFIQFADGKQYWRKIPEELEDILEETRCHVDVIAIGEEDDYFLKLSNGKEYWSIPSKLAERLKGKHSSKTVASVSLGYDDEYSVKFSDGTRTSSMKSKSFWREYDDINDTTGVKQVVIGAKGDYIIIG